MSHGREPLGSTRRWRSVDTASWLFEQIAYATPLVGNEWLLGLGLAAITAALVGLGVPGMLIPLSFSSGALLGTWEGMAPVLAGALIGSHAVFVGTRKWFGPRVTRRWGERLRRFDAEIARRGLLYLVMLRLVGAPHLLVTAASALSPVRARGFVLATLLGFLPAIALASAAGSAV